MAIRVNFRISSIGMVIAASFFSAIALTPAARSNDAANQKLGTVRTLPSLQTRAHPPLQPDTLHLGMLEPQFFKYAQDNNWAAIATIHRDEYTMHQLQPGGEGLYALPERKLVYVRGFTANIYFESDRLVGIRLTPDNRDRALTAPELLMLVRAWFPDDVLSVIYQVAPSDPRKSIVETLIGTIPKAFEQDLGKVSLPFCRAIVFPAPVPVNTLSTCNLSI
ncbi:MAG: hypothetical protein IM585_19540 [Pseudanabaena sp. M135S2SP2A07QC]|jgi:hypothetical protein|nr:hypothetical protein [Pseudanabaena sp. M110S1SP2A07QC]MCA6528801.1 hypothetical protein [Pseudanabaena sp. M125S2SP2A07QC]MCA6536745.1 hypothetical protein [Pseudanabaena sp. M176S2SP2A07QC]MCA6539361.1 hypothetical protein [Pseudanabaena sp. M037S2SP2A07QC]MCA6543541.1 hypothetical protein [Pseudanabaena sp. M074S1SP2A07QC]MCA6549242.1 hypothetical protein [Pseudanabaena sp. M152S2SP2A07QC]MCA6554113.1 hypothetical protein [Pseudanabaena sp. M135S2SP2A07QC]MCA6555203.1 hypothetical prot